MDEAIRMCVPVVMLPTPAPDSVQVKCIDCGIACWFDPSFHLAGETTVCIFCGERRRPGTIAQVQQMALYVRRTCIAPELP